MEKGFTTSKDGKVIQEGFVEAEKTNIINKFTGEYFQKIICVGLPNTGDFDFNVVASLISLMFPKNYRLHFHFMSNCLIYDARERLAEYVLQNNFEYLMFIDSDMVCQPNTIVSLYEGIQKGFDIVTGLIFKRKYPFQPCFYSKCGVDKDFNPIMEGLLDPEAWPTTGYDEIAGCGMAACLIRSDIFNHIERPLFFPLPKMGEDLAFCMKARHKGFKIGVSWATDVAHLGTFPVMKNSFVGAVKDWMSRPENEGKCIFND